MKSILVVLALAACGGPAKPPIQNQGSAEPPAPAGTAKVVDRNEQGGVIELQGDHEKAMEHAREEMTRTCGKGNAMVTQEGEELVTPDSRDTAWRVHYQCL